MATPEEMRAVMIGNMPEKTGKPLEDWLAIVSVSGLEKHGDIMKLLKGEHGMTHGFANLVTHTAREATGSAARQMHCINPNKFIRNNVVMNKRECLNIIARVL